MVDQFHELEFSVGSLGVCDILERSAQFLDGYILLGHAVVSRTENTRTASLGMGLSNLQVTKMG